MCFNTSIILFLVSLLDKTYHSSTTTRPGATEITSKEAKWGSWSSAVFCNEGQLGIGIEFKSESKQGSLAWQDDTAGNGVKIKCASTSGTVSETITTNAKHYWGNWASTDCPIGYRLVGFKTRVETNTADDTALNCISMACMNNDGVINYITASNCRDWGQWESKYTYCDSRGYICGLKEKYEGKQGWGDDTALNAVRFYCCQYSDAPTQSPTVSPTHTPTAIPTFTTNSPTNAYTLVPTSISVENLISADDNTMYYIIGGGAVFILLLIVLIVLTMILFLCYKRQTISRESEQKKPTDSINMDAMNIEEMKIFIAETIDDMQKSSEKQLEGVDETEYVL